MKRKLLLLLVVAAAVTPVRAHDFWLQPVRFQLPAPSVLPLSIYVGHGDDRERWGTDPGRVLLLKSLGPDGLVDRRPQLRAGGGGLLRLAAPGTYVLGFQTNHAKSDLPALRFNSYAELEGLTPAIDQRRRTGTTTKNGREIYSRRAKALIQVGDSAPAAYVTRPVGLSLEIVPEIDPYRLRKGQRLPIRIVYQGRPLAGALVKLTNLDDDAKPVEMHRTDRRGRANFGVPQAGNWLINTIWTQPIRGNPDADFDTTFSSLTFGYAANAR